MPFVIRVQATYCYVPAGAGGAALGQRQANWPGSGASGTNTLPVAVAQSAEDMIGVPVANGDSAAATDFQTALNTAATNLYTQFTTTGAVPGFTSGTLSAQVLAWPTGGA